MARRTMHEVCYLAACMDLEKSQTPIALLLPTKDDGGAEHVMLPLGAGCAAHGNSVDWLSPSLVVRSHRRSQCHRPQSIDWTPGACAHD